MIIRLAQSVDAKSVSNFDRHIPIGNLEKCIENGLVFVLKETDFPESPIIGILRYSLFWQTIPFLELILIDEKLRRNGHGTKMMKKWEETMKNCGFKYVMTSTQSDEDAWRFYERLGYYRVGGFFPPEQRAEEIIYLKRLGD